MKKHVPDIGMFTVLILLILSMLIGCAAGGRTGTETSVTSRSDAASSVIKTAAATVTAAALPQADKPETVLMTESAAETTAVIAMTSENEPTQDPSQYDKVIYLTFDDGPGPYTQQLLDVLDKYNVKATFFVVNKPRYNHLIAKEYEAGHTVAVHAYLHSYAKVYASDEAYFEDFWDMNEVVKEQTGSYTNLLRFPGGSSNTVSKSCSEGIMSRLTKEVENQGLHYFDWNVSAGDAGKTTDTDEVYKNVIKGIGNKSWSIVLQHDTKGFSVAAVERIIQWGLENGYTFLPLDENSPGAHHKIAN